MVARENKNNAYANLGGSAGQGWQTKSIMVFSEVAYYGRDLDS